jgi:hypothetical protein
MVGLDYHNSGVNSSPDYRYLNGMAAAVIERRARMAAGRNITVRSRWIDELMDEERDRLNEPAD